MTTTYENYTPDDQRPTRVAVVNAGTSTPSTTGMLAGRMAEAASSRGAELGMDVQTSMLDLKTLATDITTAIVSQHMSAPLREATRTLSEADAVIAATPVYKAGASGLFTSFFQLLDSDLLIGTPVAVGATGGSPRHALVVDDQLRGLFAYMRTVTVPTSLYADPEDWNSAAFGDRITRAATELIALVSGRFRDTVRGQTWHRYQHSYGSAANAEREIDLDTDLMRLATGLGS